MYITCAIVDHLIRNSRYILSFLAHFSFLWSGPPCGLSTLGQPTLGTLGNSLCISAQSNVHSNEISTCHTAKEDDSWLCSVCQSPLCSQGGKLSRFHGISQRVPSVTVGEVIGGKMYFKEFRNLTFAVLCIRKPILVDIQREHLSLTSANYSHTASSGAWRDTGAQSLFLNWYLSAAVASRSDVNCVEALLVAHNKRKSNVLQFALRHPVLPLVHCSTGWNAIHWVLPTRIRI